MRAGLSGGEGGFFKIFKLLPFPRAHPHPFFPSTSPRKRTPSYTPQAKMSSLLVNKGFSIKEAEQFLELLSNSTSKEAQVSGTLPSFCVAPLVP